MAHPEVTLFVQADAANGMGHLHRSATLGAQLSKMGVRVNFHIEADELGWEKARKLNLQKQANTITNFEHAVVDAVSLTGVTLAKIKSFTNRLLISPVFQSADIATHVLVRSASDLLKDRLSTNAKLIVAPEFAFTTAPNPSQRDFRYERVFIGICLTGGRSQFNVERLARELQKEKNVEDVAVIDEKLSEDLRDTDHQLSCEGYVDAPWQFLSKTNLFIGGEGLMISEAIAQSIPAISICRPAHFFKNRKLVEAGCAHLFNCNEFPLEKLLALTQCKPSLQHMHRCAQTTASGIDRQALAKTVLQILAE